MPPCTSLFFLLFFLFSFSHFWRRDTAPWIENILSSLHSLGHSVVTSQSSMSRSEKQGCQNLPPAVLHLSSPDQELPKQKTNPVDTVTFPPKWFWHIFPCIFWGTKTAHQTELSAPSTAPLSRHSSDPGTLWGRGSEGSQGIMTNYGHWGHALPAPELWILTGCNLPLALLNFTFPAFLGKLWKLG